MNERIKKTMVLSVFVLAAGVCCGEERTDGWSGLVDDAKTAVGQDDPFAGGFGGSGTQAGLNISAGDASLQSPPELLVQTVTLKFLEAGNLKAALSRMLSANGAMAVDDNTNSLIICDTEENLEKILTEIKKADQTPKQIMIEVVIIDVKLKDDTEIGVDWDLLTTVNKDFAYRQSLIYPYRMGIIPPTSANIDAATAYQNLGLGSELAIVNDDIRSVVNVLQEKRNVSILASPRVMVVSGQKADIKTVQEVPYQEVTQSSSGGGGASAITSTQFKEVGVTLEVKATVIDDGKILLVIKPEQSASTGVSIGGVPIIDRRQASTTLLMDDDQVVVMGGLRRKDTQVIKYQVPLLGDLPLIGFIFSDNRTVVENSELLVLLSPHVYKGEPVPAEAMARYNQLKSGTLLTPSGEPQSPDGMKK